MRILNNTIRHTGERYEVALMFRNENPILPNNRDVALRHLFSLERRFAENSTFAQSYAKVVEEYIALGHAIEAPPTPSTKGKEWFLPHHGFKRHPSLAR